MMKVDMHIINLEMLNEKYSFLYPFWEVNDIEGYPHIKKVTTDNGCKVIKKIYLNEERLYILEYLYKCISCNSNMNTPILNDEGMYICKQEYEGIMVFEELQHISEMPTAEWWANVLSDLHKMMIFKQQKKIKVTDYFSNMHPFFVCASKKMPNDIKRKVYNLVHSIGDIGKKEVKLIINHGDPLESNVMMKNGELVLTDFENACIAPKEYDLQRRLWDFAVKSEGRNIFEYYMNFVDIYQKQLSIDYNLLYNLYITDFCKTLCWLYLVSEDNVRKDCKRQREECDDFVLALRNGTVEEMLNYIKKEVYYD